MTGNELIDKLKKLSAEQLALDVVVEARDGYCYDLSDWCKFAFVNDGIVDGDRSPNCLILEVV